MAHPTGGIFPQGAAGFVFAGDRRCGYGAPGLAQHPFLGALLVAQFGDGVAECSELDERVAQLQLRRTRLLTQLGQVGVGGAGFDELGLEPGDAGLRLGEGELGGLQRGVRRGGRGRGRRDPERDRRSGRVARRVAAARA
ncbi:hypothetical protein E3O19_04720, partial [Cryobacterium algoritolerans]